ETRELPIAMEGLAKLFWVFVRRSKPKTEIQLIAIDRTSRLLCCSFPIPNCAISIFSLRDFRFCDFAVFNFLIDQFRRQRPRSSPTAPTARARAGGKKVLECNSRM